LTMARRRGGYRVVSGVARRSTEWVASADSTGIQAIGGAVAVFDQTFSGAANDAPFTIVRTRGSLYVQSDQLVATEFPFGAIGFAVVSAPAAAIGVTALPTPITDEGSDLFFVWEPWAASIAVSSAIGLDMNGLREIKIDSKAMRKVTADEDIVVTLENASATAAVSYILKFRMLLKLH